MKKVVNRCGRVSAGAIGCNKPNMMFEDEPVAVGCWFIMQNAVMYAMMTEDVTSRSRMSAVAVGCSMQSHAYHDYRGLYQLQWDVC